MDIAHLEKVADQVSGIMKILSAKNRLMILCQLVDTERSVSDLCERVGLKPPAMSQQLAILRREGVVSTRRDGQTIFYGIVDEQVMTIMSFLATTFCRDESDLKKRGA